MLIVLTQVFEWLMLSSLISFQLPSKVKEEQLIGLRNEYNRKEKIYLKIFILVFLVYCGLYYLVNFYIVQFSNQQESLPTSQAAWNKLSVDTRNQFKTDCENYQDYAKLIYITIFSSLALLILGSAFSFNKMSSKFQNKYLEHRNMIIWNVVWLFLSLGVKLFLVETMFSYSN